MIRIAPPSILVSTLVFTITALAASCGEDPVQPREDPDPNLASDFSLLDVNPNSARHNELVSPRDYLGKISAWYFGHAT